MSRRYSFCAHGTDGDACGGEVEAESFEEAAAMARDRARQRLGGGPVRLSMLTEEVDIAVSGPIARALGMDFNRRVEA